ncbi:cell division protein FtsQ [Tahibacter aquaticus]|uniref:Cell division protein FtsQ n=1 Tax=Tahibacter aquaticus TaxID=520092 RepID=A0A4R6Z9X4_9GAMM|nr:cell division protein FtsQ/DivIB [Tahibacter aquaticus]TDR48723.1 cell division protein FtsQ [Tahibacter aquaticus]
MSASAIQRLIAWGIALTLVALPVVGLLNGWYAADRWPVRQLELQAEFANVSAEQIRAAAAQGMGVGFFAVDLAAVQKSVAQLPWVEKVEARKRWPDTLVLRVYEQRPYAHWGSERLLNRDGQLFQVPGASDIQSLPRLDGPDERIAEVIQFHNEVLAEAGRSGLRIAGVSLSARGSWTVHLDSGADIVVGNEHAHERLRRFLQMYPRVAGSGQGAFEYVDLRYSNGFAMKWPGQAATVPPPPPAPAIPDPATVEDA